MLPPQREDLWKEISRSVKYEIPQPANPGKPGTWLGNLFRSEEKNSNKGLTFDRYIDLICAINYNELVQHGRVQNSYEIMIAVMGITIEKNNLDPFQVYINSAFVDDLGIN